MNMEHSKTLIISDFTYKENMNMEHSKALILSDFTYEEIINMEIIILF